MTTVYLHLRMHPNSRPGVAVCAIWPAFSTSQFQVREFTLRFGTEGEPARQLMNAGNYWVQMKMPTGEVVKEIVTIPEGLKETEVYLNPPQTNDHVAKQGGSAYIELSPPELLNYFEVPPALQIQLEHRVLIPRGAAKGRGRDLALKNGAISLPLANPFSPLIDSPRYFSFPDIGNHRFSLSLLRKEMEWPVRQFSAARGLSKSLDATIYLKGILRSRHRTSMLPDIEGNSISSTIRSMSEADQRMQEQLVRPVVREFALLQDSKKSHRFLVGVPRLREGQAAKLIVRPDGQDSKRLVSMSIEVNDPKFNSMLQFMKGSDIGSALSIAESSLPILYAKFDNPLAAAAAGYVLIQAPPKTIQVPWGQWIANLGHYFPDLPDGKILHATLLLQRGDTESPYNFYEDHSEYFPLDRHAKNMLAAELVANSLAQGPPIFRAGLSLLATNIRILASVDLPEKTRLMLQAAETLVTWLSMRVDPREPFSIFRID